MTARRPDLRDAARALRREGASQRAIGQALGIARSTVSLWVRDVALTDDQRRALRAADPVRSGRRDGQRAWSRMRRDERARAQHHGRELARHGDALHRTGCMLFWAEGSKEANTVIFTNADVAMAALFLRFLRRCYGVPDDRVRLSVNCHLGNGLSVEAIERWWLAELELPPACLRAAAVNRASSASKRVSRPLVHGTARLVVHSTFVVQSIYGAIQEYAGFERPEWLDPRAVRVRG